MNGLRRKLPSTGALFVFEAAARLENFTRAADELNVTQPAVSRTLAALEAYLETQLFVREKPGARLTADGKLLKAAVSSAFLGIEKALDAIEERKTGKVQITLSVSTAFTTHWLMPRIARFQAAFPEVDLRFQLIPGPVSGPAETVDLAMRYFPKGEGTGRFVMREAYVPVCSHGYLQTPHERGETLIWLEGNDSDRMAGLEGRTGPVPETQFAFSDYSVVVQAALMGQGIAAGWLNVVAHWLREGRLVPAAEKTTLPGRECRLLVRPSAVREDLVTRVADWLVGELQDDLAAIDAAYPLLGIADLLDTGSAH